MEGFDEIYSGEDLGAMELRGEFLEVRHWIPVHNSLCVECTVVAARSDVSILFVDDVQG